MVNCSMEVGDIMSCTPHMNPDSGTGTGLTHVHLGTNLWCLYMCFYCSVRGQATGSAPR